MGKCDESSAQNNKKNTQYKGLIQEFLDGEQDGGRNG